MYRRKIQLIAGTTYSVSLPKEWVIKNNLKEKHDLLMMEKSDRTLILSPQSMEEKQLCEITINVEDYPYSLDQILFVLYYLGFETINIFSKKELKKESKFIIRESMRHMSGTEISYEDTKKMTIKVLLDKSKVDIKQTLYRISLILDLSMSNICESLDIKEIEINENEIDRLFHLIMKIFSLSLIDSKVLLTSKINNISLTPSYLIIGKKLENIGDYIYNMARYLKEKKTVFEHKDILNFIKSDLGRSIKHLLSEHNAIFDKFTEEKRKKIRNEIFQIEDKIISDYLRDLLRYLIDIQEEVVNISLYNRLISQNLI